MKMLQGILHGKINVGGQNIYSFYRQHIQNVDLPGGGLKRVWHEPLMTLHKVHGDGTFEVQDIKINRIVLKQGLIKGMWSMQDEETEIEILDGATIKKIHYTDVMANYREEVVVKPRYNDSSHALAHQRQKENLAKGRAVVFENKRKAKAEKERMLDDEMHDRQKELMGLSPQERELVIADIERERAEQSLDNSFNEELNDALERPTLKQNLELVPDAIGE